jgi:Transposase DNA-binding
LKKRLGDAPRTDVWRVGESMPFVCQDRTNTEAAYRFLSNEPVSEEEILRGHFRSTQERIALESGPILILHSSLAVTTEGLPLELTAIKFRSRKKFKGTNALKKMRPLLLFSPASGVPEAEAYCADSVCSREVCFYRRSRECVVL